MRTCLCSLILLVTTLGFAQNQDFSALGKSIQYSDSAKNAKRFTDMEKALLTPNEVVFLELNVNGFDYNYETFIHHQYKFRNLRKLIIRNSLRYVDVEIVPNLTLFNQLEFLQIYCLSNIKLKQLSSLTKLKYLEMDGCKLKTFPPSILSLTKLEYLNLSLNFLSELPENIGEMTNLKELELTNNCFKEVPKQITQITELLYFNMNNADYKSEFTNNRWTCFNSIETFPQLLFECKKLKRVYLCKVNPEIKKKLKAELKSVEIIWD